MLTNIITPPQLLRKQPVFGFAKWPIIFLHSFRSICLSPDRRDGCVEIVLGMLTRQVPFGAKLSMLDPFFICMTIILTYKNQNYHIGTNYMFNTKWKLLGECLKESFLSSEGSKAEKAHSKANPVSALQRRVLVFLYVQSSHDFTILICVSESTASTTGEGGFIL